MSAAKHTHGPWTRASGVWWVGRQPITEIQMRACFALEEAREKRRKFSAWPRTSIAKATGSAS